MEGSGQNSVVKGHWGKDNRRGQVFNCKTRETTWAFSRQDGSIRGRGVGQRPAPATAQAPVCLPQHPGQHGFAPWGAVTATRLALVGPQEERSPQISPEVTHGDSVITRGGKDI